MILTTKGRYAVIALIEVAGNKISQPTSLSTISQRQNISLSYLEQIFTLLRKSQIVKSIKGPGGGYTLGESSKKITIAQIINATGEKIKMTRCNNKMGCITSKTKNSRCKTHDLWYGLEKKIHEYLSSVSLHDVCNDNIDILNLSKNIKD